MLIKFNPRRKAIFFKALRRDFKPSSRIATYLLHLIFMLHFPLLIDCHKLALDLPPLDLLALVLQIETWCYHKGEVPISIHKSWHRKGIRPMEIRKN